MTTQSRMSEWLQLMGDGWGYISKYWALAQKLVQGSYKAKTQERYLYALPCGFSLTEEHTTEPVVRFWCKSKNPATKKTPWTYVYGI